MKSSKILMVFIEDICYFNSAEFTHLQFDILILTSEFSPQGYFKENWVKQGMLNNCKYILISISKNWKVRC